MSFSNSKSSSTPVALVLGTSHWDTTPQSEELQDNAVAVLRQHGITRLDTARIYAAGASETAIGNKGLGKEFVITTKAPTQAGHGAGSRENVLKEARKSLAALKVEKESAYTYHHQPSRHVLTGSQVQAYLLHGPDESVPIANTYAAIQTLYEEGRIEKFGLSNFTAAQVLEYHTHAKQHNLILPTIYQSPYSPAARLNETLLFPTLRSLGISIQAYSPLAMGFLSKSPADFSSSNTEPNGLNPNLARRWDTSTINGQVHMFMFHKPSYLTMLAAWCSLAEESGVSKVGLAYRWVRYHSLLNGELGDEMIIGASSARQLEEAIVEIEKGPLEKWVAERVDALWEGVKGDAEVDTFRAYRVIVAGEEA